MCEEKDINATYSVKAWEVLAYFSSMKSASHCHLHYCKMQEHTSSEEVDLIFVNIFNLIWLGTHTAQQGKIKLYQ